MTSDLDRILHIQAAVNTHSSAFDFSAWSGDFTYDEEVWS